MSIEEIKNAIDAIGNSDKFQELFWGETDEVLTPAEVKELDELKSQMIDLSKGLSESDLEIYHWLGWF